MVSVEKGRLMFRNKVVLILAFSLLFTQGVWAEDKYEGEKNNNEIETIIVDPEDQICNINELEESLKEEMKVKLPIFELFVNDTSIGYIKDESVVDQMIAGLKERYGEGSYVKDAVSVVQTEITADDYSFVEERVLEDWIEYLASGSLEKKIHEVASGESFWTISQKYNVTVDELQSFNPDIVPERLQIGAQVKLYYNKPLVNVITETEVVQEEIIYKGIEYQTSSEIFEGDTALVFAGENGVNSVTYEVVRENGVEIARHLIAEEITKEPVNQIVARGTKPIPKVTGYGDYSLPTSRGYLSSGFGDRWGRRHNGVDYAIPVGTPLYAADKGVVTYSGWKSGYGWVVYMDHGKGITTIYAHCSKLTVSVGQVVEKGGQIALSGNSGTSTGPHVHFEMRENNVPVNPAKYVDLY